MQAWEQKLIKKQERPSEHTKEAWAKGVKRGKNSWGVGGGAGGAVRPPNGVQGQSPRKIGIVKNAISLHEIAGHSRQIDIWF